MTPRSVIRLGIGLILATYPFAASADLRITEIMYDPEGSDGKKEWVEIYNEGPYIFDLAPAKFADKSGHVLNVPPKNGGTGTMTIVPGAYVIIASDATTFHSVYPNVNQVIDTTMSLNNSSATIGIGTAKGPAAQVAYEKSLGASGTGESLQWHDGAWIHAVPTPGRENAKVSTVAAPVITAAPVSKKSSTAASTESYAKSKTAKVSKSKGSVDSVGSDPAEIVNATPTEAITQTAAVGTLGGSSWWFAAAALAISTGAAVSLISRTKKREWTIEED